MSAFACHVVRSFWLMRETNPGKWGIVFLVHAVLAFCASALSIQANHKAHELPRDSKVVHCFHHTISASRFRGQQPLCHISTTRMVRIVHGHGTPGLLTCQARQ